MLQHSTALFLREQWLPGRGALDSRQRCDAPLNMHATSVHVQKGWGLHHDATPAILLIFTHIQMSLSSKLEFNCQDRANYTGIF